MKEGSISLRVTHSSKLPRRPATATQPADAMRRRVNLVLSPIGLVLKRIVVAVDESGRVTTRFSAHEVEIDGKKTWASEVDFYVVGQRNAFSESVWIALQKVDPEAHELATKLAKRKPTSRPAQAFNQENANAH